MNLADGIRKIGFQRWYERQLIECHVYLVVGLISMVAVGACVEGLSFRAPVMNLISMILATAASFAIGLWSFRRYFAMLAATQRAAERSVCSSCHTYGRLELLRSGGAPPELQPSPWVRVRCRACGHEWIMD